MELCINSSFIELNDYALVDIDGGSIWGVISGVATVVAGVAVVIGGAALLGVPEPTGVTKFAGVTTIIAGVGTILGGAVTIYDGFQD